MKYIKFTDLSGEVKAFADQWILSGKGRTSTFPLGALLESIFNKFGSVEAIEQVVPDSETYAVLRGNVQGRTTIQRPTRSVRVDVQTIVGKEKS